MGSVAVALHVSAVCKEYAHYSGSMQIDPTPELPSHSLVAEF